MLFFFPGKVANHSSKDYSRFIMSFYVHQGMGTLKIIVKDDLNGYYHSSKYNFLLHHNEICKSIGFYLYTCQKLCIIFFLHLLL